MGTVLLTGACGRLGQVVCRHLVDRGFDVRATDVDKRTKLPVPVAVANLLDREGCYRLLDGIEAMVHLAGHPNDFARDPQTTYSENVRITVNLMHAGLESGM
ncbi:MAG: NAD-dependent epimerase/dehydratase family protein, partial [Chitinivibrionales bacterium]|nr:NAD-dependent epimerase/dehydratase family protein [Chitinivibrionales bacterium]MBD3396060.1 NAD-dependent epimerase/dehydratase family protein [Chitinivibrionales bacterium]